MNQEKHFNIFEFFQQIFTIFGVQVLFVSLLSHVIPADSTVQTGILSLWPHGLSFDVVLQFFVSAVGINVLVSIFSTDLIFKKMLTLWRIVFMLLTIVLYISFLINQFEWFPAGESGNPAAWTLFLICFLAFFVASTLIMILKTRYENKKYQRLLNNYHKRKVGSPNESNQ